MNEKILVVEDDPSILRGLQLNLGMEGYAVRSAMDGEAGLALARSERPDLIVVDVMLPKLGGLELIRAVRAQDVDTPILVLSSKGQEADKLAGLYEAVSPLGRNVEREEVGSSGMFLLSDLASGITGEIMHVDCGYNVMGSPGRAIAAAKEGKA